MTRILIAMLMILNPPYQQPVITVVPGSSRTQGATITRDGKSVNVVVTREKISIDFPNGKSRQADIIMMREPSTGLFWWRYQGISPGEIRKNNGPFDDFVVYVAGDSVFGFTFSRPSLWIRELSQ